MATNKINTPTGSFGSAMGDPFELMTKMWSMTGLPNFPNAGAASHGMPPGMPSMMAPTFDVNELDKRITDLRAVEQWLALNAGMLRATIQSLEVQRATIATLRGITDTMMAPMNKSNSNAANPFAFDTSAKAPAAMPDWPPMPQAPATQKNSDSASAASAPTPQTANKSSAAGTDAALNPAVWWNSLQDQFTKLAAAATASAAPITTRPATKKSAAKRRSAKK